MENDGRSWFENVFHITLISDRIMHYLGEDLKAMKNLSEASKTTLQVVRGNSAFLNRACQSLTPTLLEGSAAINNVTGLFTTGWKQLKLDVYIMLTNSLELEQSGTLEFAESIVLYRLANGRRRRYRLDHRVDSATSQYMERILAQTRNLRELNLEERLVFQIQDEFWRSEVVMEALRQLHSLRIHPMSGRTTKIHYGTGWEGGNKQAQSKFWKNFHQLSLAPTGLRNVYFQSTETEWHNFSFESLQFISMHEGTLETVELFLGNLTFDRDDVDVEAELDRRCTNLIVLRFRPHDEWVILDQALYVAMAQELKRREWERRMDLMVMAMMMPYVPRMEIVRMHALLRVTDRISDSYNGIDR